VHATSASALAAGYKVFPLESDFRWPLLQPLQGRTAYIRMFLSEASSHGMLSAQAAYSRRSMGKPQHGQATYSVYSRILMYPRVQ
jgi:hypothetical protein